MRDWPHAPAHQMSEAGAYLVTAGTYQKKPLFASAARLTLLCDALLCTAEQRGWRLQAWAVFPNHYHFIAEIPEKDVLPGTIRALHSFTANAIYAEDEQMGRKLWFHYWETRLTFQRSYIARLSYVHQNAVHHGLVHVPSSYPWCSAGWLGRRAARSLYRRLMEFQPSHLNVPDDFAVEKADVELPT